MNPCDERTGPTAPAARTTAKSSRREFLRAAGRYVSLSVLAALAARLALVRGGGGRPIRCPKDGDCPGCALARPGGRGGTFRPAGALVWQLDPAKCIQCGRCATACVLSPSAVKCMHAHAVCGYCELCFGYFDPGAAQRNENAENQLCPTGAIARSWVEDPYYRYTIDERLCIGCGKCVKGCAAFGNGSLFLQVRHDLCVDCNECAIARVCPADAFRRVPIERPYIVKPGMDPPMLTKGAGAGICPSRVPS